MTTTVMPQTQREKRHGVPFEGIAGYRESLRRLPWLPSAAAGGAMVPHVLTACGAGDTPSRWNPSYPISDRPGRDLARSVAPRPRRRSAPRVRPPSCARRLCCASRRVARMGSEPRGPTRSTPTLGVSMPIATPEIYSEMIDRAKSGRLRLPGRQRHLLPDPERRPARLRRGRVRRHRPGLHRRRRLLVRRLHQGHGGRLPGLRRVRPRGRQELRRQHRPAHGPLPQGQAGRLRPAAAGRLRGRGQGRPQPALQLAHVGRLRRDRCRKTCASPANCWSAPRPPR